MAHDDIDPALFSISGDDQMVSIAVRSMNSTKFDDTQHAWDLVYTMS